MVSSIIIDAIALISAALVVTSVLGTYYANLAVFNEASDLRIRNVKDRLLSDFVVVDLFYNSTDNSVLIFLKNVGLRDITHGELKLSEIYITSKSLHLVIPYSDVPLSGRWNYEILNDLNSDGVWGPGETVVMSARPPYQLSSGTYKVKVVMSNGVTVEETFSR